MQRTCSCILAFLIRFELKWSCFNDSLDSESSLHQTHKFTRTCSCILCIPQMSPPAQVSACVPRAAMSSVSETASRPGFQISAAKDLNAQPPLPSWVSRCWQSELASLWLKGSLQRVCAGSRNPFRLTVPSDVVAMWRTL